MRAVRAFAVAGIALAATLGLSGCGEEQQVTVYQQGKYKGKADNPPWDSPQWGGKEAAWETAINRRTLNQSEYTRTGQGG
jgi:hypothetical protein